jgi:glycosyltransferase involved in cell wall biosynthesis
MRVVNVVMDRRYFRDKNNRLVSADDIESYSFFQRYLDVFDKVYVIARINDEICSGGTPVEGPGITVLPLPYFVGGSGLLMNSPNILSKVWCLSGREGYFILRSGTLASLFSIALRLQRRSYAVEVILDPFDSLSPSAHRHILRPLFQYGQLFLTKQMVAAARYASFVTGHSLQRRYPPRRALFNTHYSSIDLPATAIAGADFIPKANLRPPRHIVLVGPFRSLYKGQDTLVQAFAHVVRQYPDARLSIAGAGIFLEQIRTMADQLGVGQRVHFAGHVKPGAALEGFLDDGDLFALPSRQEGLPRAMIEAMARGLPCIGSTVGGIPELISHNMLVPPDDVQALSNKIVECFKDPERMVREAIKNLERAHDFRRDVLEKRRREFYAKIADDAGRAFVRVAA